MTPLRSKLSELYGEIINGIWMRQHEFLSAYNVPGLYQPHLKYEGHLVTHITMHKLMIPLFDKALAKVYEKGLIDELKSFDGCFNIRNIRGGSRLSVHSYGLAIDLNAATNPLGGKSTWSDEFVQCFKDQGFVWGGDFLSRKDPMHFQYCKEDSSSGFVGTAFSDIPVVDDGHVPLATQEEANASVGREPAPAVDKNGVEYEPCPNENKLGEATISDDLDGWDEEDGVVDDLDTLPESDEEDDFQHAGEDDVM